MTATLAPEGQVHRSGSARVDVKLGSVLAENPGTPNVSGKGICQDIANPVGSISWQPPFLKAVSGLTREGAMKFLDSALSAVAVLGAIVGGYSVLIGPRNLAGPFFLAAVASTTPWLVLRSIDWFRHRRSREQHPSRR